MTPARRDEELRGEALGARPGSGPGESARDRGDLAWPILCDVMRCLARCRKRCGFGSDGVHLGMEKQ